MEQNRSDTLKAVDCVIRNLVDSQPLPKKRKIDPESENPDLINAIPVGKEEQFQALHRLLNQGLIGAKGVGDMTELRNVSGLLFGPRGSGKSLVLDACISALQQNNNMDGKPRFRVVRLNGIAIKGHDVTTVLREICKQLSEQALAQSNYSKTKRNVLHPNQSTDEGKSIQAKLHEIMQKETHAFRMRQTTFNNTMTLVDEALQTASIDSIPILIVLEELDAFFQNPKGSSQLSSNVVLGGGSSGNSKKSADGPSERHVLLYHLLDRVAGKGSLVSLVGITSRLTTVGLFEKRVKSRAEGTSTIIYFFDQKSSYENLVDILLSNFDVGSTDSGMIRHLEYLRASVKEHLLPPERLNLSDDEQDKRRIIMDTLSRSCDLGKTMRWFNRVLHLSLVFYSLRLKNSNDIVAPFEDTCLLEALEAMGATIVRPIRSTDKRDSQGDFKLNFSSPRIKTLLDLSSIQLAILLAAKRIITRDQQRDDLEVDVPLTYERIEREYETFSHQFDRALFFKSFCKLFGGLIMPCKDSTGSMPLMYFHSGSSSIQNINEQSVKKMPIQMNVDIDLELGEALSRDTLPCNAALKDWAKFK